MQTEMGIQRLALLPECYIDIQRKIFGGLQRVTFRELHSENYV